MGIRLLLPGATRPHQLLHSVCGFHWDNAEAGTIRILTNCDSLPIGRLIRNLTWPRQLTIEIFEMSLYHQACQHFSPESSRARPPPQRSRKREIISSYVFLWPMFQRLLSWKPTNARSVNSSFKCIIFSSDF